ncbi:MAG: hypothetical protein DRI97_00095 [Bacteroidetes bacterium]|nr:MAG: hypothetical protein DRI97_00095 [Bacteroidota bacterium]
MQDFKLDIVVKVTAKPVNPKVGTTQRGPYERNLFVVSETKKVHYVGDKADIAGFVADAIPVIARQWELSASEPPEVTAQAVVTVATTTATVPGIVDDQGVSTVVTAEYGVTEELGSSQAATQSPLSGDAPTAVTCLLTGLTAGTQYYYRIKALSAAGTIFSELKTFTTPAT